MSYLRWNCTRYTCREHIFSSRNLTGFITLGWRRGRSRRTMENMGQRGIWIEMTMLWKGTITRIIIKMERITGKKLTELKRSDSRVKRRSLGTWQITIKDSTTYISKPSAWSMSRSDTCQTLQSRLNFKSATISLTFKPLATSSASSL